MDGIPNVAYVDLTVTIFNTGSVPLTCNIVSASPNSFDIAINKEIVIVPSTGPRRTSITSNLIETSQFESISPVVFNVLVRCSTNTETLPDKVGQVEINFLPEEVDFDVAYVYEDINKVDENVLEQFDLLELTVQLVPEEEVAIDPNIIKSNYRMMFLGDENYDNPHLFPIEMPTIIMNHYHEEIFGITDSDGLTKRGSSSPLKVNIDETEFQVYTQAKDGTISIPLYYIKPENSVPGFTRIVETLGVSPEGSVIAYSDNSNLCFFGITETEFWTANSKRFFRDCTDFVNPF